MRTLILALLVAACAAAPMRTLSGLDLDNTHWRVRDFDIPAGVTAPTMTFLAGRANGTTGCNRWSAIVGADGRGNLRFSAIEVTERACEPPTMDVERRFLERLRMTHAADYGADVSTLRLIGPEADHLMSFDALRPPGAPAR